MPKLTIYHYPSCFFCKRVRSAMQSLGLELELRDIHQDPRWRQDLIDARGRKTVPVLRIEGDDGSVVWMGESKIIVRYLQSLPS